MLERSGMWPENLFDKLDLKIQVLATHTDQVHLISGTTPVLRVINGQQEHFMVRLRQSSKNAVFYPFNMYNVNVIFFQFLGP